MLKKRANISVLVAFCLAVSACGDKGKSFIGHWSQINTETPTKLDIEYDDGMYHVDADEYSEFLGVSTKVRFEAKAESNSVLSAKNGMITIRLLNDEKIAYKGIELAKTK